jgi:hypothetical protein
MQAGVNQHYLTGLRLIAECMYEQTGLVSSAGTGLWQASHCSGARGLSAGGVGMRHGRTLI